MPRLVVTKGTGVGRDHAVTNECVVGRGADADFVLEDTNASRRHCRILLDGSGYAVEDLGSRNGTYVNGTRVQRRAVGDGDVIRIGATEFVFRQQGLIAPSTASAARAIAVPPAVVVPKAISVPPAVRPAAVRPPVVPVPVAPPAPAANPPPDSPAASPPVPASAPAPAPNAFVSPTPTKKRRTNW